MRAAPAKTRYAASAMRAAHPDPREVRHPSRLGALLLVQAALELRPGAGGEACCFPV